MDAIERRTTALSRQQYGRWSLPGSGIPVYFRWSAMDWIAARVRAAAGASGAVSGVLLGAATYVGGKQALVIEGADSIRDTDSVESQIRRLQAQGAVVMGAYRGANRPAPDSDDCELFEQTGDGVGLFIAGDPTGGLQARASLRTDGRRTEWSEFAAFPFGGPEGGKPLTANNLHQSKPWVRISLAVAVITAVVLLWLLYPQPTAATPARRIELTAERSGSAWSLKWNPQADWFAGASAVYVNIADGPSDSRFFLSPETIRAGSLTYVPSTDSVEFSVEAVRDSGERARETLIVIRDSSRPKPPVRRVAVRRAPKE